MQQTQKIWLEKSYPPGVPFDIDPDKYSSLTEMFNKYVDIYAERTSFINMGRCHVQRGCDTCCKKTG